VLHKEARTGDADAEERLFEYLSARLRLFVLQRVRNEQDCEEIVQEALRTILEKYKDIEFQKSFAAWAYRVLENKILAHFKAKRLEEKKLAHVTGHMGQRRSANPDATLETKLLECLHKLGDVNRRYARILNLHYQGYTVTEICEKLNLTHTNLYTILSRARSLLLTCLEKGDINK
jgi:RNA polymerase sigma factor (sigma-70 family)